VAEGTEAGGGGKLAADGGDERSDLLSPLAGPG
jgi:hypothetical protein